MMVPLITYEEERMVQGKPGEGLPRGEFWLIRLVLIPMVRTLFTWEIAYRLFRRETRLIASLVEKVKHDDLQRMMEIDKTFGIEDHSRQFSVNMVLEHLTIAGRGVMGIISTLSQDKPFERYITIEGVKPFENKADALSDFNTFVDDYDRFFRGLAKKHSRMTTPHPWFRSFNNFDWAAFMYMHTFIHRRQIEAIIAAHAKEAI